MEKPTKDLAKKLGAVTMITPASVKDNAVNQLFDYLIVLDFESTCWEDQGRKSLSPEIIEFPAVLLNLQTGKIEEQFQKFVFPVEQPRLSTFCIEFTGISQAMVEKGVPLGTALFLFKNWLSTITEKYKLDFHKRTNQNNSLCTVATWSDWDLTKCLNNECRRKNLMKPKVFDSWIDLRASYQYFYKRRPDGLKGALEGVGLQFIGKEHSGLNDSLNTGRLAHKMVQDGCLLDITKTLNGFSYAKTNKFAPSKGFWG